MSNSPIRLRVIAASVALVGSAPASAADCVAENCTVSVTGMQTFTTEFPIGIPLPPAVNTYLATVFGAARADGGIAADAGSKQGIKLTITSVPAPPKAISGVVTKTSTIPLPKTKKGSGATGSTVLTGSAANTLLGGLHGVATTTYSATLTPLNGGTADYHGITTDPFPFGVGGLSGTGIVDFGLTLPSTDSLVPAVPDGAWSLTFSAGVSDMATFDDQKFWGADPGLIYTVTFGTDADGAFAHFIAGSPAGFPVTFDRSASQIEAALIQDVNQGSSIDLDVFDGTVDLTGHSSATVGNASEFLVSQVSTVPEPPPLVLWTGPLLVLSWRGRRPHKAI